VRAPASLIAIPLLAGSAVGLTLPEYDPSHLALNLAAGACLALLAGVAWWADDEGPECAIAVILCALLTGGSLGVSDAARAYHPPLLEWFRSAGSSASTPVLVRGVLREDASVTPLGVSLSLWVHAIGRTQASRAGTLGGVRLSVAGSLAPARVDEWRAGRAVRVTAILREPVTYRNPGAVDERRALARRGVALVGSVKSAALVDLTARGSIASEWAAACRAWSRSALTATVGSWAERSGAIARAILIGDRTGLALEDERRLQEAGTYHVIAISGGNIAILTLLILGGLRAAGVRSRAAAGTAIVLLLFYGRVTGSAPSVDRAITAAVVFLTGRLIDHRGPPVNVLAVAAVLAAASSPVTVMDAGFLMSFGATLGILIGVPRILRIRGSPSTTRRARRARRVPGRVARSAAGLFAATLAAEVVLAPVSASLFSRVTFAGLLLNFVAIPLMTIVQAGSLAALAAWPIDAAAARTLGYAVHRATGGLIDSARLVEVVPWISRDVAPPAWWLLVTYYIALIVLVVARRRRVTHGAGAAVLACGLIIASGAPSTSRERVDRPAGGWLRVAFLDVNQGDATAILLPDGRAFLVDTGGLPAAPLQDPTDAPLFDIGERVLAPALRALAVRRLDTLVLTHADSDHIGGARAMLRSFHPRAVWEGVPVPPDLALRGVRDAADAAGAEWRIVQAGDQLRVGRVELRALHPPIPDWERQRVRNDDSVVLDVRIGEVSIILPGDVGRDGEAQALRHLARAPVVVLKAAHHGSATSSTAEFLDAVRPAAVIVSAGRANRFGHPAPAVVARYRTRGIPMFTTGEDGAVILDTDGKAVEIRGWGSGRVWRCCAR
jgi:competence protein ComEC